MAGARVFVFMCVRGLHRGVLLRGHAPFLRCGQPLPEPHAFSWAQMRGGGGVPASSPVKGREKAVDRRALGLRPQLPHQPCQLRGPRHAVHASCWQVAGALRLPFAL